MQAFAFYVVTVNDKHTNLGAQERVGVKYIDGLYAKFCLKLWFESDWYFCNMTESRWF